VHAHEKTVVKARALCGLCTSKRFKKVLPSFRQTQALNYNICASLLSSHQLGSSTSEDEIDILFNYRVSESHDIHILFNCHLIDMSFFAST
jgi:hypothetical protein